MKIAELVQAVIILLLLALAAGCDVTKEYSQKVFGSTPKKKQATHDIKFLDADSTTASEIITMKEINTEAAKDTTKTTASITEDRPAPVYRPSGNVRTRKVRQ